MAYQNQWQTLIFHGVDVHEATHQFNEWYRCVQCPPLEMNQSMLFLERGALPYYLTHCPGATSHDIYVTVFMTVDVVDPAESSD
jgi:hypothetical protein